MPGCVRLPLCVDAEILRDEVARLPQDVWGTTASRVNVHARADAIFLRGYAPAEGERPISDRPVLASLPYTRTIIHQLIGAHPLRCLLARLGPGGAVPAHVDEGAYFEHSIRIHVPVESNDHVWMVCASERYVMRPGEVWTLDNRARHSVWNQHTTLPRTHLICDFIPEPRLLSLIAGGDSSLGVPAGDVDARLAQLANSEARG